MPKSDTPLTDGELINERREFVPISAEFARNLERHARAMAEWIAYYKKTGRFLDGMSALDAWQAFDGESKHD